MRNAPRAYGLRMSCFLAVIVLFFTALGMASIGWIAHVGYEHYRVYLFRKHEIEKMKMIYSQPIIMQQKSPNLVPEPTPMPEKRGTFEWPSKVDKPDCGTGG